MKPRGYLVLDIETVPDHDLYTAPDVAAGQERPFPPLWAHRPIVIGVLWLDERYAFKRIGVLGEDKDEHTMLSDLARFSDEHRPHLVTYNGRGFDLPVLQLRALRHGVPMRFAFERNFRYRFTDEGHMDLFDFLSDHGAAKVGSLDALAHLVGLPGKVGVDGSQVEGLYNAGQLALIKNYCLSDVTQTAFLLLRYRLVQGVIDLATYRAAASALVEALAADPRVEPVVARIDRPRLLLE
ncbi:MAG: 3'-5' exonuclease [Polyangia bacterium]